MAAYAASTQGQLDNIGHATGSNIGQNITNAANASVGYILPGAYEQAPQSYTSTVSGGGAGGGAAADPYAAYGGAAAYNNLLNGFNTQNSTITSSANDAANNAGVGLNSSILDLIDSLTQGQNKVNNQGVQAELAKRQGTAAVQDYVGHGIQSGGVTLANKNASNSSAAEALARAYGDIGRRQLSQVGNQYASAEDAVNQAQSDVDLQRTQGVRHIQDSKTQTINSIVADATTKLAALDASMSNANLSGRINIEQEKNSIRQNAINALQQYDQTLNNGLGGISASSNIDRVNKAAQLQQAGTAPDDAFSFTTDVPVQQQNTGPFASTLPIFTYKGKDQSTGA